MANALPTSNDLWNNRYTASMWDAIIEEEWQQHCADEDAAFAREERETKAWNAAYTSLRDHLHDLGCMVALTAWSHDDVSLDAGRDEEGVAVYAQLAAAVQIAYDPAEDDRSKVNAWLEREYNERYEEALEASSLTLTA